MHFEDHWDPALMRWMVTASRALYKLWFRCEVRGWENFPEGGALIVSNHSGGVNPPDAQLIWSGFFQKFGFERPIFTLTHDMILRGPAKVPLSKMGMIPADREVAAEALRSGAAVIVFPGGDYDALRPTSKQAVIDFDGRTGYARTAIEAGVPIVPAVSIGGQETQLFLTRGIRIGLLKRLTRVEQFPLSIGVPFGLTPAINFPLPAKITTQVLPPIDIKALFGKKPDAAEVDEYVRGVMQGALSALAAERRLPILG